ncbi:MAG TPA: hypothetical protein VGM88_20920 [Kofleriaceae bacterium]|jgi:hypothetical protein
MSGPARNPDKLNQIGVVVVGICGAVLVYVSITALQAFYMDDTAGVQTMADYGGQESTFTSIRTSQETSIHEYKSNPKPQPPKAGEQQAPQTFHVDVTEAMKLVVRDAKTSPGALIPGVGPSAKATIQPIFGRPILIATPAAPAAPAPTPDAAGSAAGAAAPPVGGTSAPLVPTGAGQGAQPSAGGGALPTTPIPAGSAAPAVAPMEKGVPDKGGSGATGSAGSNGR